MFRYLGTKKLQAVLRAGLNEHARGRRKLRARQNLKIEAFGFKTSEVSARIHNDTHDVYNKMRENVLPKRIGYKGMKLVLRDGNE